MSTLPTISSLQRLTLDSETRTASETPSHDAPLPKGDRNENPQGIGLLELLAEDYRTYDHDLFEPALWIIALHRFGNARMGVRSKFLRAPLTVIYRLMYSVFSWMWGIQLPYNTKLGRRVRIWHHGGIWIGARAIGDDVHIRHNTTFGLLSRSEPNGKPIIGNRVDVGVGACILGAVTVGDDCVIGANSVVLRDLPPGSVVMGVPARQTAIWKEGTTPQPESKSRSAEHTRSETNHV